jgi:uncharacterized Zn-binding protein involved in type VI secretion
VAGACSPDVLVNGRPIARAGDAIDCPGGAADSVFTGCPAVLVNGKIAARQFDRGFHCSLVGIQGTSTDVLLSTETMAILGDFPASKAACLAAASGRDSGSTKQSYQNCGLESVRQLVNQSRRPPVDEDRVYAYAVGHGYAEKDTTRKESGGTSPETREAVLEHFGVASDQEDQTPEKIQRALSEGKGVITSHNAAVLWDNPKVDGAHAVVVTGVKYDEHGKVAAYRINDTGSGECGVLVPAERFEASLRPQRKMNVTRERVW